MGGVSQAAYHGVPVVALPFFGDQPSNAGQAVARVCNLNPESLTSMTLPTWLEPGFMLPVA